MQPRLSSRFFFLSSELHMLRSQSSLPYPALNSDNQGSVSTNHLWESHPEQNPFHCQDPFTGRCRKEGTVRAICFTSPGPLIWSSFGFLGSWHHRGRCSQPLCSVQRSWPTVYSGGCSFPLNWWTRGCELRCRKSQACEGPNRPSQWPALLTGGAGRGAASAAREDGGMSEKAWPKQITENMKKFHIFFC